MTPEQFIDLICEGHSYCNVFKGLDRRDVKFEKAYQVSIDIDDSDIPLSEFLKKLPASPTTAYTTFSNDDAAGKYRFRLMYWSKYAICSKKAYTRAVRALSNYLGIDSDTDIDKCSLSCTQIMNGTGADAYRYVSGKIYNFEEDFGARFVYTTDLLEGTGLVDDEETPEFNISPKPRKKRTYQKKSSPAAPKLTPLNPDKEKKLLRRKALLEIRDFHDSTLTPEERNAVSYTDTTFLSGRAQNNGTLKKKKRNKNQYKNIKSKTAVAPNKREYYKFWKPMIDEVKQFENVKTWLKKKAEFNEWEPIMHTPLKFNAAGFAEVPENYIELPVLWNNTVWGERTVQKFTDGMHRRETLYSDLIKIRLIKPHIGIKELFWQGVWRVEHYYDNSDGVLSLDMIARKTWDAMFARSISRFHVNNNSRTGGNYIKQARPTGSIVVNTKFCRERCINPLSHSRLCVMIARYMRIEKWYNPNLSVRENFKFAKEHKIDDSSERTLRRFCEYLGLSANPKRNTPADWYNPGKSVNGNMQWAADNGIKTSSATLYNYCKAHGIDPKGHASLDNGHFGYNQPVQSIKPGINESAVLSKAIMDMLLKMPEPSIEKAPESEFKNTDVIFDVDWSEYFGEITENKQVKSEETPAETPVIINNEGFKEEPEEEKYRMTADEPVAFDLDIGDLMSRLHKSKCQNPVPLGLKYFGFVPTPPVFRDVGMPAPS